MHTATRGPGRRKTTMPSAPPRTSIQEGHLDLNSVLSAGSGRSKVTVKEDRGITLTDVKLIMPTVLILLFTLFIMVTVIPYAFSSVIKQLQAVQALEAKAAAEEAERLMNASTEATNGLDVTLA